MSMVVLITNLTDGPKQTPSEVRLYNQILAPGADMRVDARYIDEKVRKLQDGGFISIGKVPPWYADYTAKRKKRNLSAAEVTASIQAKKDYDDTRAARIAAVAKEAKDKLSPQMAPSALNIADRVSTTDEVVVGKKELKKDKRKR